MYIHSAEIPGITEKNNNHCPLKRLVKNTLLTAMVLLPGTGIASTGPVRFASHYKIEVEEEHLFDIDIKKDTNNQVEISIQPQPSADEDNDNIVAHPPSECDGTCHIYKWTHLYHKLLFILVNDQTKMSLPQLLKALYHSLFITPGQDISHSSAAQTFTASFNDAEQNILAIQYTLAGKPVAQIPQTIDPDTAGRLHTTVVGSDQIVTTNTNGEIISMPFSQLSVCEEVDSDSCTRSSKVIGEAATFSDQLAGTISAAGAGTATRTVTMLGTAMEQLFNNLLASDTSGISELTNVIDPLMVMLAGGDLIPLGVTFPDEEAQAQMAHPQVVYQQGYSDRFSYDPTSNSITQGDKAGAPYPSNVIYHYRIDDDDIIDQITITEHGARVAVFTAPGNDPDSGPK